MGKFVTDKRQVRKSIKQLQRVKTWQLLVLLILMAFVAATFLRLNNIGMSERRDAVMAADKSGDSDATQKRLYDLQRYVDAQQMVDAAKESNQSGPNINALAEEVCRPQYTVWSPAYVQCFADELAKYPPSDDPVQNVTLPSTELYRYSFAGPLWSADFAGWSVAVCIAIILMILGRLISLFLLQLLLKREYRSI